MKKILWGIYLIAFAIFVILTCTGVNLGFVGTVPVLNLIVSALLVICLIDQLCQKNWVAAPFILALIFMLFEKSIAEASGIEGGNLINNWILILCALLISIGVGLITSRSKKFIHISHGHDGKSVGADIPLDEKAGVEGRNVKFGAETKYIDCTTFQKYYFSVKLGAGEVHFENTENYQGGGTLILECKMGAIEVYVPKNWHLDVHIDTSMGESEIPPENGDGPTLTITGVNNMGAIEIHRV